MEKKIKKEFLKECELFFTQKTKQLITGKPIKIFNVNNKDGTSYKRTEMTPWPVNEFSRRSAKKVCRNIYENIVSEKNSNKKNRK